MGSENQRNKLSAVDSGLQLKAIIAAYMSGSLPFNEFRKQVHQTTINELGFLEEITRKLKPRRH